MVLRDSVTACFVLLRHLGYSTADARLVAQAVSAYIRSIDAVYISCRVKHAGEVLLIESVSYSSVS
jgi:hypothetical protein